MKEPNVTNPITRNDEMTRKEALKKAGKYAAFTATAMLSILTPKESQASSFPPPPTNW